MTICLTACSHFQIKKRQDFILSVLQARKISFEEVDISDPTREADKQFMREKSPPKEGQSVVLPPQIFNSDVYRCVSCLTYFIQLYQ
jgi:hypothetical protein